MFEPESMGREAGKLARAALKLAIFKGNVLNDIFEPQQPTNFLEHLLLLVVLVVMILILAVIEKTGPASSQLLSAY